MNIDTSPRSLGMAGGLLMAVGVFAPIVSLPLVGSMTYIQNGSGAGLLVLVAGILGALLSHRGSRRGMLVCGIVGGLFVAFTFLSIQYRIQQLKAAMGAGGWLMSGLADMMSQTIQMQWGWALLVLGAALLIYGGCAHGRTLRLEGPRC